MGIWWVTRLSMMTKRPCPGAQLITPDCGGLQRAASRGQGDRKWQLSARWLLPLPHGTGVVDMSLTVARLVLRTVSYSTMQYDTYLPSQYHSVREVVEGMESMDGGGRLRAVGIDVTCQLLTLVGTQVR